MLDGRFRERVGDISKPRLDELRRAVEQQVASFLSKELNSDVSQEFVIAHSFSIKSVRESSRNDENQVLVHCGDRPRFFTDESKLLGSINEAYSDDLLQIYAPVSWPDPSKKDELRQKWRPQIREIIEEKCRLDRSNLKE